MDHPAETNLTLPTAFVIESDPHYLLTLTTLLREMDMSCKRNTTGEGVFEQIAALPRLPMVILISLELPCQHPANPCPDCGLKLAHQLHKHSLTANIPLLAMTTDARLSEHQHEIADLGFTAVLTKPLPRLILQYTLARLLEREAHAQPAHAAT